MKVVEFVFDNVIDLAGYAKNRLENPTPLKIQKTLYFLWGFYSATYGSIKYDSAEKSEFDLQDGAYPHELFKPEFEAWRYGAVINKVYLAYKKHEIKELSSEDIQKKISLGDLEKKEILLFINNLIAQINEVDDFGLVQKAIKDSAWKDAYLADKKMNPEKIKDDYVNFLSEN